MSKEKSTASDADAELVQEAVDRAKLADAWEATADDRGLEDTRFANGDPDNQYQWPDGIRISRGTESKPMLTMNICQPHVKIVSNGIRKNKQSMTVQALGGGATAASAQMFGALIRRVETRSRAQLAYTIARESQLTAGIGYWRIITDWTKPDSFDQDALVMPVLDPFAVRLDPGIKKPDGSDAGWGMLFDAWNEKEFERKYPKFHKLLGSTVLGTSLMGRNTLISGEDVEVCEYYRKEWEEDEVVSFLAKSGERQTILRSRLPPSVFEEIADQQTTKVRDTQTWKIKWYLIVSGQVVDRTDWLGQYIPIIRVPGRQAVIDGTMDRKGLIRNMKDAQRMYNYNASAQVEFGALQTKVPWSGAADAITGYEQIWRTANTQNHPYLPFRHLDKDGQALPPTALPRRNEPPAPSPAFQMGMETAAQQIMMTSGQYQNQLGQQGNERTGAAIGKRQEQSDTVVFDFEDNYSDALVFSATVLLDLLPKLYDTKRVLQVFAENGEAMELSVDPRQQQALAQIQQQNAQTAVHIFNPAVGEYEVAPSAGPAYGSKRQETAEMLGNIIMQAPALTGVLGDLLIGSLDFEKAQEAAQRMKRMVPPMALGQGPTQAEQQLQAQNQELTGQLTKLLQHKGKDAIRLQDKDQLRDIEVFKAETDRLVALQGLMGGEGSGDAAGMQQLVQKLVSESLGGALGKLVEGAGNESQGATAETQPAGGATGGDLLSDSPPVPGAQKAPDGEWYLTDPTRQGRFLHVAPLAQEHSRPGVVAGGAGAPNG